MKDRAPSFHVGLESCALHAIRESHINVAIWQRATPVAVAAQIAKWGVQAPAPFDSVLHSEGYDLADVAVGLERDARAWLLGDIAHLIGHFLALARAPRFRLFFGAIRSDQCRKFHVDHLRLRLVTTYAGPGTEWLPDEAVDRSAMADASHASHGDSPLENQFDEANRRIVKESSKIRRARAGDVVLLKGAHFGPISEHAAVHRSPPIEGARVIRVALIATAYRDLPAL